jgi:hypothetical protein
MHWIEVSGQLHAPTALLPGHKPSVTYCMGEKRYCREEKDVMPLPGIKLQFLGCPAHSLITIPTELLRLCKCDIIFIYLICE